MGPAVIGGSSDPSALDSLRSRAADLGLEGRVEFIGGVERSALPGVLNDITAFALPEGERAILHRRLPDQTGGVPGHGEAGSGHCYGRHPPLLE